MRERISRWTIGLDGSRLRSGEGLVALTAAARDEGQQRGAFTVAFHELSAVDLPQGDDVVVHVPRYRGNRFVDVLSYVVASRLAAPGATVSWIVEEARLRAALTRRLGALGWEVSSDKSRDTTIETASPGPQPEPSPEQFTAVFGAQALVFEADFGVFSAGAVDDGTRLLFDVACGGGAVDRVADVGTGYGVLAISLVRAGIATQAVGTEVDAVALWLAGRNAAAAGVDVELVLSADPAAAGPNALTVCNVPTHVNAADSASLMAALATRALDGRLLLVVHKSLEQRYAQHLVRTGLTVERHEGAADVVLETGSGQ